MKMRKTFVYACALGLCFALMISGDPFLSMTTNAEAVTTYWCTYCPSAYNSSIWQWFWEYGWDRGPYSCTPAEKTADGSVYVWGGGSCHIYIETGDYTDPEYWGANYSYYGGTPAPNNGTATITAVSAYAVTNLHSWDDCRLYYSTDNRSTWTWSPSDNTPLYGVVSWNITGYETWTAAMLNSPDLWVGIWLDAFEGGNYQVGYVGLVYWYSVDWAGGVVHPEDDVATEIPTFHINATAIVPIMGMVGFIGMIAMPAMGFMAYRNNSEDRITTFVKILVAFMFCLTMFLVSISA